MTMPLQKVSKYGVFSHQIFLDVYFKKILKRNTKVGFHLNNFFLQKTLNVFESL